MYHKRCSIRAFVITMCGVLFCLGSISLANAVPLPDPMEQLRPLIGNLQSILTDPNLQGEAKRILRRKKVMASVSEQFDFPEMSKRVLGKTWKTLSKDEQTYFVTLFTSLLEHAYISQIEDYSEQKVEFKRQRIKGKRAQVITTLTDRDGAITVSYIMMLKNDLWRVYDIVVEGVSLVRNYMEQFKEFLSKEEYATLVKQLEEKISDLEADDG